MNLLPGALSLLSRVFAAQAAGLQLETRSPGRRNEPPLPSPRAAAAATEAGPSCNQGGTGDAPWWALGDCPRPDGDTQSPAWGCHGRRMLPGLGRASRGLCHLRLAGTSRQPWAATAAEDACKKRWLVAMEAWERDPGRSQAGARWDLGGTLARPRWDPGQT